MIEIKGKHGVVVKIVCDSISEAGIRLITYELVYQRMVHSELLTHGMLVRNAASSRAIPFNKMAEQLTARPVRFGQANPGMQDKGEDYKASIDGEYNQRHERFDQITPEEAWHRAKEDALDWSERFYKAGYHKQVYNRLTEPFQMMKTVLSGTELENFFWLRNHGAADPTLEELARCMHEARVQSVPRALKSGQWHLPYVAYLGGVEEGWEYYEDLPETHEEGYLLKGFTKKLSLEEAIKVSCARTAAVSFRNEDYGLEKCLEVYARLIGDERKHASAMQHAATPMHENSFPLDTNTSYLPDTWQEGVSHADRNGQLWSAQFKGWIMWRKTIAGENYIWA